MRFQPMASTEFFQVEEASASFHFVTSFLIIETTMSVSTHIIRQSTCWSFRLTLPLCLTMTQLLLSFSVDSIGPEELTCSRLALLTTAVTDGDAVLPAVILLGLPASITRRELEIYMEPFAVHIEGFCMISERSSYDFVRVQDDVFQYKKSAVIFFLDCDAVRAFQELYNNLQLPSYSENAPTLVVHPGRMEVDCSAELARSVACSSPVSAFPSSSGSPHRASSPYKRDIMDSWYQRGVDLLLQFCSSPGGAGKLSTTGKGATLSHSADQCSLPTCTVCLRRIRCVSSLASGLSGASDLMVGRSYTSDAKLSLDDLTTINADHTMLQVSTEKAADNGDNLQIGVRCIVCHIYHTAATSRNTGTSHASAWPGAQALSKFKAGTAGTTESNLGKCRTCNLSENIWVCLQCGHTGCGRYTSQHAKAHFQDFPTHHLSLELASGRIWNYATDTFVYIEDESAHYITPSYSAPVRIGDERSLQEYARQGQASPTFSKKFLLPSFLYPTSGDQSGAAGGMQSRPAQPGRYQGHFGPESDLLSEESAASLGLDCVTTEKINALMSYYERLLETQLLDQQLYFEKLLARETVRALESSYQHNHHQHGADKETPTPLAASGKKSSKSTMKGSSNFASAESKVDSLLAPTTAAAGAAGLTHEAGMHINSPFLTRSNAFAEAQSALEDTEVLRDMHEVELLKLEISAIEADYRGILEAVRSADDQVRQLKKENDALIRSQKAKREHESLLRQKTEEVRQNFNAQIADMEQQIKDLSFYTRTRTQLQESPLRDEIKGGTVVTKQKAPEPAISGGNSKKGSGRKS